MRTCSDTDIDINKFIVTGNFGRVEVPNVGSSAEKKGQNLHQAVKYTSLTKSKTLSSLLRKYSATNLMSTGISPSR